MSSFSEEQECWDVCYVNKSASETKQVMWVSLSNIMLRTRTISGDVCCSLYGSTNRIHIKLHRVIVLHRALCVCVRISILWADGGRGCLALMTVHPDGWCQSDTEAQQHLKSLGGEFESCSNSYSGSHSVWTISARLRSPHLLPYISSRWLTVSVGTFQESVFALSTAAFDMFFFFFPLKMN